MNKEISDTFSASSFTIFDNKDNIIIHEKLDYPLVVCKYDSLRIDIYQKTGTLKSLSMPKRIRELEKKNHVLQRQINRLLEKACT